MLYVVLWRIALNMKEIRETGDIRGETRGPAYSKIRGILFVPIGRSLFQIPNQDSDLLVNCGEWTIIFHRSPGMELPPELEEPITCSYTSTLEMTSLFSLTMNCSKPTLYSETPSTKVTDHPY